MTAIASVTQYQPEWYASPIDLPERTVGKFSIVHEIIPVGGHVGIIGIRQAMLRGLRPMAGLVTEKPLRIHRLQEGNRGLWMTDLPEELNQIAEMMFTVQPRGRVLVGGLGLGIVASVVAKWPGVDEVIVIEREADVIDLCGVPRDYTIIKADIREYLARPSADQLRCDYYLLDTWAGTNEGTWWDEVVPLRRSIRHHWGQGPTIHCWAEDIMLGQIMRSLTTNPPHWYTKYLKTPMRQGDAERFTRNIGLPAWEKAYGAAIDRVVDEMKDEPGDDE